MTNNKQSNDLEKFRSQLEYELNQNHTVLSQKTTNLPVASSIENLENSVIDLTDQLEFDKKDIQILRGELLHLGYDHNEENQTISTYIIDEITRIGKSFKQLSEEALLEDKQLFDQIQKLNQDRIDIYQQSMVLEHRINENEYNVGYKGVYDIQGTENIQNNL